MNYDPASLKNEIPQLEKQAQMFEDKAVELRASVEQYKVWIAELEKRLAK